MVEEEHKEEPKEQHEQREEHKLELPRRRRKNTFWMIATAVLFGLLIISMFTKGFTAFGGGGMGATISGQEAGDKVITYVNDVILQGRMNATVEGDIEEVGSDLYKVNINIQGQVIEAYVTRDGKWLFPQGIDMNKKIEITTEEKTTATACEDYTKVDKPVFDVYYMSYCPYGIQAMTGLYPVAKLFGDKIEIVPHYVIYDNYGGGGTNYCIDNGKLCSMHGIEELNEDIRQACVYKYQKDKFWDYTNCAMTECSLSNIKTCWETCADKNNVDKTKVQECFDNEGKTLMEAEKKLNDEKGVSGSPTMFLNGDEYIGGRSPDQFKENICCGFKTEPSECSQALSTTGATTAGSC